MAKLPIAALQPHAKIVSIKAKHLINDGNHYREERPLTGDESRVAEVKEVKWPKLLDAVDDIPPATIITSVRRDRGTLIVQGVSHDNGDIAWVTVNDKKVKVVSTNAGVVDWQVTLGEPASDKLIAFAKDKADNVEQTAHTIALDEVVAQAGVTDAATHQASGLSPARQTRL